MISTSYQIGFVHGGAKHEKSQEVLDRCMHACLASDAAVPIKDLHGSAFAMLHLIERDLGKYCTLFELNDNETLCFRSAQSH
jgi:hypothetical protein